MSDKEDLDYITAFARKLAAVEADLAAEREQRQAAEAELLKPRDPDDERAWAADYVREHTRCQALEAELADEREQRQVAETVAAIAVDPDAKLIVAAEARCKALEAALVNACDALRQEGLTVAHCAQVLTEADALLQPPPAGPATGAQADA